MRNLHIPSRSPIYSKNAMVATSHPEATMKALEIIKKGGNAMDAAVTAASVLAVVEAHSTGIGGDCFCIFYSNITFIIPFHNIGNISLSYINKFFSYTFLVMFNDLGFLHSPLDHSDTTEPIQRRFDYSFLRMGCH